MSGLLLLALVATAIVVAVHFWCGALALVAALLLARLWCWPRVKWCYYFTTARIVLPAFAFATGSATQLAFDHLADAPVAIGWGAVAAACLFLCARIFEKNFKGWRP